MNNIDRFGNQTPTRQGYADLIESAWQDAYCEWEEGRCCSPSADDLVALAADILPESRRQRVEALDERLYEKLCDGIDLGVVARWLVNVSA